MGASLTTGRATPGGRLSTIVVVRLTGFPGGGEGRDKEGEGAGEALNVVSGVHALTCSLKN